GRVSADYGCVFADGKIFARQAQERDEISGILKTRLDQTLNVVDQSYHPDYRSRQNAAPFRLIIETNVAGHDRGLERLARFGDAVDDLRKRPHHFGAFGRSKVQAVGNRNRLRLPTA